MDILDQILEGINELTDTSKVLAEVDMGSVDMRDAAALMLALDRVNKSIRGLNQITKDIIVKDSIKKYMKGN